MVKVRERSLLSHNMIQISNAERLAMEATALALEPPPPVDFVEWAETNIVFTDRESPFPGPYNRTLFPYFDEVFRALGPDDPCRTVTVLGSAQVGKTVVANIFTRRLAGARSLRFPLHPSDRGQCPALVETEAGADAARDLRPGEDLSAEIARRLRRDPDEGTHWRPRLHPDLGRQLAVVAVAGLDAAPGAGRSLQVGDEFGRRSRGAGRQPLAAHEFAKILKLGTPLVMPGCRITRAYELGSQEKPYVPCPHCDEFQVLEWENMLAALDLDHPEFAHFTCTACGCEIEEHHRPAMLARLEWRASNECETATPIVLDLVGLFVPAAALSGSRANG